MQIKCPFCPRTFSNRSAYSQHMNFCMPPDDLDMSLSDDNIEEVGNL